MNLNAVPKIKATAILLLALTVVSSGNLFAQKAVKKKTKKTAVQSKLNAKATAFELEDQFNKKLAVKFPSKKVTVLVFGDRKGAEQIEGWVRPLYEKYADKIEIHGVAELSVVPWIAKGFVRNTIKSKSKKPIMLDWSGKVSKDYGYEKAQANVFVVSRTGEIIAEKRGAASSSELEDLYKTIGGGLK